MGLILGGVVAAGTIVGVILIIFADSMSDAPSQSGISIWPTAIIGFGISGLLIGSHWMHLSW